MRGKGRRKLVYAIPLVHIPTYLALVSTMTLGLWPKSLLPAGVLTGTCGLAATACTIFAKGALAPPPPASPPKHPSGLNDFLS